MYSQNFVNISKLFYLSAKFELQLEKTGLQGCLTQNGLYNHRSSLEA